MKRITFIFIVLLMGVESVFAQSCTWIYSTEGNMWKESKIRLQLKPDKEPALKVDTTESIQVFKRWGTCLNELGWDALNLLPFEQQKEVLSNLFSKEGALRFSMGRIPMNANDYARDWYSCDEVSGDFQLKYFSIERDKKTIIPFCKRVLHCNPDVIFWASPWSPPSWMKVNHYYSVRSWNGQNKMSPLSDVVLYENTTGKDAAYYPKQLAVNDYLFRILVI